MPEQPAAGGSTVLIDEYLASGDDCFLVEVLASRSDKKLLSLAEPWLWDPRPFARRTLLAYIDDGCDRSNHRPLVKRLFKGAEATEEVRRLRAVLDQARKTGRAVQNREGRPHFAAWLRGKLAYLPMVDRERGVAMLRELDSLPA